MIKKSANVWSNTAEANLGDDQLRLHVMGLENHRKFRTEVVKTFAIGLLCRKKAETIYIRIKTRCNPIPGRYNRIFSECNIIPTFYIRIIQGNNRIYHYIRVSEAYIGLKRPCIGLKDTKFEHNEAENCVFTR